MRGNRLSPFIFSTSPSYYFDIRRKRVKKESVFVQYSSSDTSSVHGLVRCEKPGQMFNAKRV